MDNRLKNLFSFDEVLQETKDNEKRLEVEIQNSGNTKDSNNCKYTFTLSFNCFNKLFKGEKK